MMDRQAEQDPASLPSIPPDWKLPRGVDRALWQYLHHDRHAGDYDQYLKDSPLAEADLDLVFAHSDPTRHHLIDLGCGTGRLLSAWKSRSGRALGVDLSPAMLRQARQGLGSIDQIALLEANLVDLKGVESSAFDRAVCLYSTLGMIATRSARVDALKAFRRVTKPGGKLLVHAHNLWANLWHPRGRAFLGTCLWDWIKGNPRAGDFINPIHQGMSGLALHMYTRGELVRDLSEAGWGDIQILGLDRFGKPFPGLGQSARAIGWFGLATKPMETN